MSERTGCRVPGQVVLSGLVVELSEQVLPDHMRVRGGTEVHPLPHRRPLRALGGGHHRYLALTVYGGVDRGVDPFTHGGQRVADLVRHRRSAPAVR
ncbi:hypothetical protein [Streptomyces sp. NPDC052496]|uniref:hypothetical protein n=1 Tax=Streptomyces sp. NPDC052496 TaxID=3154951 RepID=UPI0034154AA0